MSMNSHNSESVIQVDDKDESNLQNRSSSYTHSHSHGNDHDDKDDSSEEYDLVARNEARLKLLLSQPNKMFTFPAFYEQLPPASDTLLLKIRENAMHLLIRTKGHDLLVHEELQPIYGILEKHASPPFGDGESEKFISYLAYKEMLTKLPQKCQKLLNARTFLKLMEGDPYGRVPIASVFNYVMRKTWLIQTRMALSYHDEGGRGTMKEAELENYIMELIPTLVQLARIEPSFVPFYACNAVRRFMFFLDPSRTGRIKIIDILTSGFLDDLLDLRENRQVADTNWFGFRYAMRVYANYLNLDLDRTGMLSKSELINYGKRQGENMLTQTFVDHVFQECLTFYGDARHEIEMDYRAYLDFVLAMDYPTFPQSIQYFFRILDFKHQGFLDSFCINYFYKDIGKISEEHGSFKASFEDINDEIFDMVKPEDPCKITLQDLIKSGNGHKVIRILIDYLGYLTHENQEGSSPDNGLNGLSSSSSV